MIRPLLRAIRRAPERLLHRRRRRRAVAALRHMGNPHAVLVMCYGNICRSPFAGAALSQRLAPLGTRVESAGLYGPDRGTPREGITAAAQRGVDLTHHRSRLVTAELVATADVVVVMDSRQARAILTQFGGRRDRVVFLGDFDPLPIRTREVRDPERQSVAVFAEVYERIERCADTFSSALGAAPARTP